MPRSTLGKPSGNAKTPITAIVYNVPRPSLEKGITPFENYFKACLTAAIKVRALMFSTLTQAGSQLIPIYRPTKS